MSGRWDVIGNKSVWKNDDEIEDYKEESMASKAEITYQKTDLNEWLATLATGTQFVFRSGEYYDLALLSESGWITLYTKVMYIKSNGKVGQFTSLSDISYESIIKNNVIVAAKLSERRL